MSGYSQQESVTHVSGMDRASNFDFATLSLQVPSAGSPARAVTGPRLKRAAIECVNASRAPLPLDPNKKYCVRWWIRLTSTEPTTLRSTTYPASPRGPGPADGVSIFAAFQEQLGLKLQAGTRPVDKSRTPSSESKFQTR